MEAINNYDYGLTSMVLEAEMVFNNLYREMMIEEAHQLIMEAEEQQQGEQKQDSSSSQQSGGFKEKVKRFVEGIVKLWRAFIAKLKDIINKVIINRQLAVKFLAKYDSELSKFKGSSKKTKVNPMMAGKTQKLMASVNEVVKSAQGMLNQNVDKVPNMSNELKGVHDKMNKLKHDINQAVLEKHEVMLDTKLLDGAIQFLKVGYKQMNDTVANLTKNSEAYVTHATRQLNAKLMQGGVDDTKRNEALNTFMHFAREAVSSIIQVNARMIAVGNQTYVDSFAVCREAVSVVRKGKGSSESEKKTDEKEEPRKRKDVTNDSREVEKQKELPAPKK
jgi:hypothetical protein